MKKLMMLLVAVFFAGCEVGYVPIRMSTNKEQPSYSTPESKDVPKEEIVVKQLAPIDDTLVYIWDEINKCMYLADDLPDGEGDMAPKPFYYTDGTVADVVAFEFYKPDRHFYFKVHDIKEIKEDGITVRWEDVYRIFRQINGKMSETDNPVFPAYGHNSIKECTFKNAELRPSPDVGMMAFFPTDEWGVKMGFCSWPMKYFSMFHVSGDTLWCIAERMDVDHPQLFMLEENAQLVRWTDHTKAVYKY